MSRLLIAVLSICAACGALAAEVRYYAVPEGSHPHDVAPAPDGSVWYTSQPKGALGRLDPATGKVEQIDRKSTRLNSSHSDRSRMPSSA